MISLDNSIFQFIHQYAGHNKIIDLIAIFFATYAAYFIVLFWIILFFKERGWKKRFYFFSLSALSTILSRGIIAEVIGFFYYRPRPFVSLGFNPLISVKESYSFPSGHMTFYFALFLAVFYLAKNKPSVWWFFGSVVLMGLARIYTGVHWPTDIIAGALIGLFSAFLIRKILPKPEGQEALPI